MDLKRLPYLPINFFYFQFNKSVRSLFLLLFSVSLIVGGFFFHSYVFQEYWPLQIHEVAEAQQEQIEVRSIHKNYREIALSFPAYRQWVSYTAGPLIPSATPIHLFMIFQLIAWTFVLAVSTLIRSRWAYLFYILFALFIHFTDVVRVIYPNDTFRLLEFVVIASYLGLAYAFQMNMIRWSFSLRLLVFSGLSALYFGLAYHTGGWLALHKMSVDSFLYLILISVAFLFFIAKEPTNLIMIATNNRKDRRNRLGPWPILAIYLFLLLLELVPALDLMGFQWLPMKDLGLRPAFLILISALFTVFTSQNQFHTVRKILSTNIVYSFLLLSWAVISLSFFFLIFSQGDYLFIYAIERLAAEIFLGVAIMHIFFIYTNHFALLKEKINLYYLMAQGRKFSFVAVAIFGLMVVIIAEGKDNWRSFRLFFHNFAIQHADHDLLSGNREDALSSYRIAREMSPVSIKANYNLASLLIADPKNVNQALDAYQRVSQSHNYPYARMNAANLLMVNNETKKAEKVLKDGIKQGSTNAYLASNLGYLYHQIGQADSAIVYFKHALSTAFELSSTYSNLGLLYEENNLSTEAQDFIQAAASLEAPSEAAMTNLIYYSLKHKLKLDLPLKKIAKSNNFALEYNYLLYLVSEQKLAQANALSARLSESEQGFEAQIVDAYLLFQQDSIIHALSKVAYLNQSAVAPVAEANFMLGVAFYERGVPEMARKYFMLAGEAGDTKGYLYAAKMDLDLGRKDSAQLAFTSLRVEDESLWEACSRELAMLLQAYGQESFAMLEWDLSSLSRDERMRISLYADSINFFINAEGNFSQLLQEDSTYVDPYLEMGRIYNSYGDSTAILNLQTGLSIDPTHIPLQIELARAYLLQAQYEKAAEILQDIPENPEYNDDRAIVESLLSWAEEDTTVGEQLAQLNAKDPLNQEVVLLLCQWYLSQQNLEKANRLITQAVEYNTENSAFWYDYALVSKAWGLQIDAGFGAARAIELSMDSQRKAEISQEFEAELKLLLEEG